MQYEEGLIIGRHRLVQCLDRGGEAEVWKAVHRDNSNLVSALKLRPPVKRGDRDDVNTQHEAFKRECNTWIGFAGRCLYIVNILDVVAEEVEASGVEWVVHGISSEFAELGDLQVAIDKDLLRTYIQGEVQFIQFLSNITAGAAAGQRDQICHCDIKPKNILIFEHGSEFVPKLMDFGVSSRVLEPLRGLTPDYAAPELMTGSATMAGAAATELSDVYSLGKTFLDILIATLVEPGPRVNARKIGKSYDSMMAFLEQDTVQAGQPDPTVPYRKLIASMVRKNPDERPRLAEIASVLQSSLRLLLAKGPQYSVRTQPNVYLWNPILHEMVEEKLHYVFIKGGNPSHDLKDIIKGLENVGACGYSLRSVTGAWDYILRVWASRSSPTIKDICEALAYNSRRLIALEVASQQLTYAKPKPMVRIVSEAETLKAIEACAGDGAYEKLKRAGYVGGKLNHARNLFRVTLLIEVPSNFLRVAQFAGSMITQEIQKDARARDVSSYDVHSVGDFHLLTHYDVHASNVRLIIKFMHANFLTCRETLLQAFAAVGDFGNDFKFSTLFDMSAEQDVLSDDGSIISRIQAACSDKR